MKKQGVDRSDDEPLSLDMTFDEALEMLLNTSPPDDQDQEDVHKAERNQDDCE